MRSLRLASILVLAGASVACTALLGDFSLGDAPAGSGADGGGDGAGDGQAAGVTITPAEVKVGVLRVQPFTAPSPVTWSVEEGPAGGTIDADGKYVSPATPGTFHIVATSKDNPAAVGKATVTVVDLQLALLAGPAAGNGTVDGPAQNAHFSGPEGIAQFRNGGGFFVADTSAHTIRMYANGVVTTLAGAPLQQGFANGKGADARFYAPTGIAAKDAGRLVFVADTQNHCIRKIEADTGMTTTLTGTCGKPGTTEGGPDSALFDTPTSMTINHDGGTLYVCELAQALNGPRRMRQIDTSNGKTATVSLAGQTFNQCQLGTVDFNGGAFNRVFFTDGQSQKLTSFIEGSSSPVTHVALPDTFVNGLANDTGFGGGKSIYVSVSSKRSIYAYDTSNDTFPVLVGDPAQADNLAVNGPFATARFSRPSALSEEQGGPIYVADGVAIRKVDLNNRQVSDYLGKSVQYGHVDAARGAARFALITGVTTGTGDTVYVSDSSSDGGRISSTIRAINLTSGAVTTISGLPGRHAVAEDGAAGAAKFGFPFDIAREGDFLYVADALAHAIRKVSLADGSVTSIGQLNIPGDTLGVGVAAAFKQPSGVASDGAGNVYVADSGNFKIKKIAVATGQVSLVAGTTEGSSDGPATTAQLKSPAGLACDRAGNLYVADTNDHTIRKIVLATGEVSTLIGQHGVFGFDNGGPAAAKLFGPIRVAFDNIGGLYVTEGFVGDVDKGASGFVRRIDIASRTIAPFMGKRGELGFVPGPLPTARVNFPLGVTVTAKGDLVYTDLNDYTVGIVQAL